MIGGIITKQDLQNYVAVIKEPLVVKLNDNSTIFTPPPPSSGAVYAMILNIADSKLLKPAQSHTETNMLHLNYNLSYGCYFLLFVIKIFIYKVKIEFLSFLKTSF